MSKLCERLKELMDERGWNQVALAEKSNVQHTNVSDFLSGKHSPSYTNLVKLVYAFDCSADYLLGNDEMHTEETLYPVLPFDKRFRAILKEQNVSQERLKKELPVSASVLYKWLSGKNQPTAEILLNLAKYLECSVDYLLGRRR